MIMVTGASGLLGANLILEAQRQGSEVTAIYNQHQVVGRGIVAEQADLTCKATVVELIESLNPTWIVHCAALTDVDWCEEHPADAYRVNTEISRSIAWAANRVGARLAYISTDSVFDGQEGGYCEKHVPSPVNVYAASKLAGEVAVREEVESGLVVRTNIYGWNLHDKESLAEWILLRLEGSQIVPGFADVVFTPMLVNDLSKVILDMMDLRLTGLYHVAGSEACTKYEFAAGIAEEFGFDRALVRPTDITGSGLKAERPLNTALQTGKVSEALNRPMPDVRSGLGRFKELQDSGYVRTLRALR